MRPRRRIKTSQRVLTQGRLPVELDVGHAALLVDEGVGVHAKALHVAVVQRDPNVVLQEGELQSPNERLRSWIQSPHWSTYRNIPVHAWHTAVSADRDTKINAEQQEQQQATKEQLTTPGHWLASSC